MGDGLFEDDEQLVARRTGEITVELHVEADELLTCRHVPRERVDRGLQQDQVLVAPSLGGEACDLDLDDASYLAHLVVGKLVRMRHEQQAHRLRDLGWGGQGDDGAGSRAHVEQALGDERAYCLSHDGTRDAELLREHPLGGNRRAHLERTARDPFFESSRESLGKRALALYGPEVHGDQLHPAIITSRLRRTL